MSNACKNSLLIIVAVIVCVATPLLGSKVFAQSELLFPVAQRASYTAPSLEAVFAGHPQTTVSVENSILTVQNVVITTNTRIYIEEVPAEDKFLAGQNCVFLSLKERHIRHRIWKLFLPAIPTTTYLLSRWLLTRKSPKESKERLREKSPPFRKRSLFYNSESQR